MCGIAGIWDPDLGWVAELRARAAAMTTALAHRGPDGEAVWLDPAAGIALGHRRLAIIDVSPEASQPMRSADGRLTLTYNGEIYNFAELRAELTAAGRRFRTSSDTEVLVEACAAWGVAAAVRRLIGIFAFALWDASERRLTLVRDHFGVKPLYWSRRGSQVLFGSELKALRADAGCRPEIDPAALGDYLTLGYVPAPRTIYRGISKLPPGTILTLSRGETPRFDRYWDAEAEALAGMADPMRLDDAAAAEALDYLLRDVVRAQMVSDVPIGALLSGGIDSSTVTACMQAASPRPIRSFTIGFEHSELDESRHARAVAGALGTAHTELVVERRHVLDLVPSLPDAYDEPFADGSQLPTMLVSALARRDVTVVLSGDGGDELFGGYLRYSWGDRIRRMLAPLPLPLRCAAASAVRAGSALLPARPGALAAKAAEIMALDSPDRIYRRLLEQWPHGWDLVRQGADPRHPLDRPLRIAGFIPRMQMLDTLTYLPDDILTKVDRASMHYGLEARVPLLDPRVFRFAWRLAPKQRVRHGRGKLPLRRVLERYVPRALFERPKQGFGAPIGAWLRGPLREWAGDLLSPARIEAAGILDPVPIAAAWQEHQAGRDRQYRLWTVLMFEAWRDRWDYSQPRAAAMANHEMPLVPA